MMLNPDPLAALRLKLRRAGFYPVPCEAKAPPLKGWQELFTTNAEEISLWSKSWHMARNTGALAKFSPALDIDLMDEDACEAIETLLGQLFEDGRLLVRIGKAPKRLIPFRAGVPFKKRILAVTAANGVKAKLEFLGDGQQYIVDGVHPETGAAYCWHGADHLADVSARDLPLIRDDAHAQEVLDQIGAMLVAEHGYTVEPKHEQHAGDDHHPGGDSADWAELTRRILSGVDIHDSMVSLSASHATCGMPLEGSMRTLRSLLLASTLPRDERFQNRLDDIVRTVRSGYAKFATPPEQETKATDEGHWHGEISAADSRTWVIHDLVPEIGKGLISGQWGTFKTFTALEMAHAMMSSAPFLGFDVVRQGGVAFFALEGGSEIPVRLQALIDERGLIKGKAPFVWYDDCPSLLSTGAVNILVKRLDKAAVKMKDTFGLPLVAVFIDTMVLAAAYNREGGDNDTATTAVVLRAMADLATRTGCFVFGIDHFGKTIDVGTRGNSVKEGNADLVLALLGDRSITGEISNTKLAIRKRRGGANGQEFPFTTRTVDMGVDQHGRPVTTLVLDWGKTAEPPKDRRDDWGKGGGKLLRQIIMSLLAECGVDLRPFADGPMVKALKVELVRSEFFKRRHAEGDSKDAKHRAKRMAFQRAIEAAVNRGVIATREVGDVEYVWLTSAHAEMHAHAER